MGLIHCSHYFTFISLQAAEASGLLQCWIQPQPSLPTPACALSRHTCRALCAPKGGTQPFIKTHATTAISACWQCSAALEQDCLRVEEKEFVMQFLPLLWSQEKKKKKKKSEPFEVFFLLKTIKGFTWFMYYFMTSNKTSRTHIASGSGRSLMSPRCQLSSPAWLHSSSLLLPLYCFHPALNK